MSLLTLGGLILKNFFKVFCYVAFPTETVWLNCQTLVGNIREFLEKELIVACELIDLFRVNSLSTANN